MVLGVVQKEQSPSCLCDLSAVIGPGYIYEREGCGTSCPRYDLRGSSAWGEQQQGH